MTQEDLDKQVAEWNRRSKEGDMITIKGPNGHEAHVPQGLIDVMKELHGIDVVTEIQNGMLPWISKNT